MLFLLAITASGLRLSINAAKICEDNEDFKDAMGYPCSSWRGFDCSTAAETFSFAFDEAAMQALLANCRLSCGLCDPDAEEEVTTTTTTTAKTTAEATAEPVTTTTTTTVITTTPIPTTTTVTEASWWGVDMRFSDPSSDVGPPTDSLTTTAVGDRVVRGPGWTGGLDDGGVGVVGVVEEYDSLTGQIDVRWPTGHKHEYNLQDGQLSATDMNAYVTPWQDATATNTAVGTRVRRGRGWRSHAEDSGGTGIITEISEDTSRTTVEWSNGLIDTYSMEDAELSVKAERGGVFERMLEDVWREEMQKALSLIAREEEIIAEAQARCAAEDVPAEEHEVCEEQITRAEAVIKEAERMYDMAEEHLEATAEMAEAADALGDHLHVETDINGTLQRTLKTCEDEVQELEILFAELISPKSERFGVAAVPSDPNAFTWPVAELHSFGTGNGTLTTTPAPHINTSSTPFEMKERPATVDGEQYRADLGGFGDGEAGEEIAADARSLLYKCLRTRAQHKAFIVVRSRVQAS